MGGFIGNQQSPIIIKLQVLQNPLIHQVFLVNFNFNRCALFVHRLRSGCLWYPQRHLRQQLKQRNRASLLHFPWIRFMDSSYFRCRYYERWAIMEKQRELPWYAQRQPRVSTTRRYRCETVIVRGQSQIRYRELRTGRFIKKP